MAQLCPKCNSTQFKVKLVAEGIIDLKNDNYDLVSQGDMNIEDGSMVCSSCGTPVKAEELRPALLCNTCNQYHPAEEMYQLQNEDGSKGDFICKGCYEASQTPAQDQMSREQLMEQNKNQADQMAAMQQQMAQMQKLMAQMQAGQQAPAQQQTPVQQQAPVQQVNQTQAPVNNVQQQANTQPVQQSTIATNLPNPGAQTQNQGQATNVIDPSAITPEQNNGAPMFGGEAPF